jgi:tetratricopeptide (TPR) repeat protein
MNAELVSLVVSRIVPLMLITTVVLVVARFVADRIASGEATNRAIFGGLLVLGLLLQVPFAFRSLALLQTERAILRGDAGDARIWLAKFRQLGGTLGPWRASRWMGFLVRERLWADARAFAVDLLGDSTSKSASYVSDLRVSLAISCYYLGRSGEAEAALRAATSPHPEFVYLARYFEGRLAERRGDTHGAIEAYSNSLTGVAGFRPALYQLVRLLAASGRPDAARDALARVLAAAPASPKDPLVNTLRAHVAAGTVPPEKEFEIVVP